MKKLILPIMAIFLFFSYASSGYAQDSTKVDRTLRGQYLELLNKSKSFYGSKIINPARLNTYWKNVSDTLTRERKQLRTSQARITELQKTITDLKSQVEGKESALTSSNQKLNQIRFLGMDFEKGSYNSVVWTLILVLALALIFVIIRSARHIQEAKYRSNLYEEVAAEFQNYKIKANDKEKKLARELQDERNKFEDFKSRGR